MDNTKRYAVRLADGSYQSLQDAKLTTADLPKLARFMLISEFGYERPTDALVRQVVAVTEEIMDGWKADEEYESDADTRAARRLED